MAIRLSWSLTDPKRRQAGALAETELVERLRSGDVEAFEPLMRRYNRRLFRIARSILNDDAEAEDVVQEAYVKAYSSLTELRDPRGFGAWLSRIAANEARMQRRRSVRRAEPADPQTLQAQSATEVAMAYAPPPQQGPEASTERSALRHTLEQAIDELPEGFRSVFVLREVEQLSVAETADCLELEPATVKTRTYRAKKMLRDWLTAHLDTATVEAFDFAGERCDRTVRRVLARVANS